MPDAEPAQGDQDRAHLHVGTTPLDRPAQQLQGSCALHLADAGVVFSGDALITYGLAAPARRRYGPQLVKDSWQEDPALALASLDRLEGLGAHTVLSGHGEPWTGGIDAAVEHARSLGRY